MADRRTNILFNTDWITILIYLLLVIMGWINIYAAVYNEDHQSIFDLTQKYGKQLLWIGAAILLGIIIFLIDSKFYSLFSYPIYIVIVSLLIFVLVFGKEVHGAKSWFDIGPFRLQPSEFAKFATVLALSRFLSSYNLKLQKLSSLIIAGVIMFAP
ncbi:MAG: rod shape-determining protein RodA, partial [Marinilabiliales bacterium]